MRRLISGLNFSRYTRLLKGDEGLPKYTPSIFHPVHLEYLKLNPAHADIQALTQSCAYPAHDMVTRDAKLWRGSLCMVVSEALGGTAERALPTAVSLEILHSASLIADDIEDNSLVRRGKPCTHLLYSSSTAINCSNYMFFLPLQIISQAKNYPDHVKLKLLKTISEELTKLTVGQGLDIEWAKTKTLPSLDNYLFMIQCKTAVMVRLAVRMAGYINGASDLVIDHLSGYADNIGIAFQIKDDLLNLESQEYASGRSYLGEDITEGKRTAIVIRAVAQSQKRDRLIEILDLKTADLSLVGEALEIIRQTDALEWARHLAEEHVRVALLSLKECDLPPSDSKSFLENLGEFILTRVK